MIAARSSVVAVPAEEWHTLIHDLRNPLATISAYTQLLRRRTAVEAEVPGLDESLHHIQDAAARLDRLVDQLATAPDADDDCASTPIDLVPLARQIAAHSPLAIGMAARVTVLSDTPQLIGAWDVTAVERVLGNVIDNALKYSPAERPVVVTLKRREDWAEVHVSDRGIGIPAEDAASVFKRGYRATNVGSTTGSGLGLATVRQLVTLMGGEIALDSTLGVGTTVVVRLPLREEVSL